MVPSPLQNTLAKLIETFCDVDAQQQVFMVLCATSIVVGDVRGAGGGTLG